jgi:hypothetical protein
MKIVGRLMSVLFVLAILFIAGCDKDDAGPNCNKAGEFSLTLNGENWVAASFNNTFVISTTPGLEARRLDIRAFHADGSQLIFTISDSPGTSTGDCVTVGDFIGGDLITSADDHFFFATYLNASGSLTHMAHEGDLEITMCSDQSISGTFSFEGEGFEEEEDFIAINGSFSNICYRLLK